MSCVMFLLHILDSLNPKFQAASHLLCLYSLLCVGPSRKTKTGFLVTWLILC